MPRILVTRHVFASAIDVLREAGDVDYRDSPDALSPQELRQAVTDKDAVLCQLTDCIDANLLASAPQLKVVANIAVGYDNIDVEAAAAHGIVVTNTPDVLTETTADLAFALMLAAARRLGEAERFLRAGRWRRWEIDVLCGQDVHGKTLGILGLGRIGRAVARRGQGFGMRIIAPRGDAPGVRNADLTTVLREADFLSIHVPLSEQTHHLVGAAELALMKPTAVLVNTARGPIVDEAALANALASGEIAAAGLDVFEDEPAVHPALLELDNAVLVPHIGSASVATRTRMCTLAAENVVAVLAGRPALNALIV